VEKDYYQKLGGKHQAVGAELAMQEARRKRIGSDLLDAADDIHKCYMARRGTKWQANLAEALGKVFPTPGMKEYYERLVPDEDQRMDCIGDPENWAQAIIAYADDQ
jgi:hypothetical protein